VNFDDLLQQGAGAIADADLIATRDAVAAEARRLGEEFDAAPDPVAAAGRIEALVALVGAMDERLRAAAQARLTVAAALGRIAPPPLPAEPPAGATSAPMTTTDPQAAITAAVSRPRPADPEPPEPSRGGPAIVAAAGSSVVEVGAPFRDRVDLGREMNARYERLHPGDRGRVQAVVAVVDRPERELKLDLDAQANVLAIEDMQRRLQRAPSPEAITAAAGPYCAPAEPVYDYFDLTPGGLLRLPSADAPRGKRIYPVSTDLADITGDWASMIGSQTSPKPCYLVPCGDTVEAAVNSYPICLRWDNTTGRFYPERVAKITADTIRFGEFVVQNALVDIIELPATSETVNAQNSGGGFVVGLVRAIRHGAAYFRQKHYLPPDFRLEGILPAWVPNAIATDIVTRDATLDFARTFEATVAALSADNITWQFINGWQVVPKTGFENVNAGAGLRAILFAPGTLVRLDGGAMNLGVVRDSNLNPDNQFETFVETWEGLVRIGPAPVRIVNIEICTSGGTGDRELVLCGSGS